MAFIGKNPPPRTGLAAPTTANTVPSLPSGVLAGYEAGAQVWVDPDDLFQPVETNISAVPPLPAPSLSGSTLLLTPSVDPALNAEPFMGVTVDELLGSAGTDIAEAPPLPAGSLTAATRLLVANESLDPAADPFLTVSVGSLTPLVGGGGGYTPLPDTDGLLAHYDVSHPSSAFANVDFGTLATVNEKMGLLDDVGGSGRLVQEGDSLSKPTLVEVGGRRAVRFTGSQFTRLSAPLGPNWMALNTSDITWAFVFRTPAVLPAGTNSKIGSICNLNDTTAGLIEVSTMWGAANGPTVAFARIGSLGGNVVEGALTVIPSTLYVVIVRSSYGGGTLNVNMNGVDSAQVNVGSFGAGSAFDLFQFGSLRYAGDPFTGDLLESAVYRTYKDAFGVARLHRHLSAKYGA